MSRKIFYYVAEIHDLLECDLKEITTTDSLSPKDLEKAQNPLCSSNRLTVPLLVGLGPIWDEPITIYRGQFTTLSL